MVQPTTLETVATWIRESRHTVALTGAGISTDSGIPDFRGPNGVWTKNPAAEKLSTLSHYMADREVRVESWKQRLDHPAWQARPNPGHVALADLERSGRLQFLVTQNIDGLHLDAGSSPARTIEIHGTMREVVCMECGERAPMARALDRVRAGEQDPQCRTCGGILKSATISFGRTWWPATWSSPSSRPREASCSWPSGPRSAFTRRLPCPRWPSRSGPGW